MGLVLQGRRAGEVARQEFGGRTGDWLRKLERAGIIPEAPRDFSGYRVYTPEYVEHIRQIILNRRRPEGTEVA